MDDNTLQAEIRHSSCKIVDDGTGKPRVHVQVQDIVKSVWPEEISAMILLEMRKQAEDFLECPVRDTVISVPAHFGNDQRLATMDAGRLAGLNVLGIVNEPTAAALKYTFDNIDDECQRTVLVYHLGGGYLGVSVLKIKGGNIQVVSTGGDDFKGGEDIDSLLQDHFAQKFTTKFGLDIAAIAKQEETDDELGNEAIKAFKKLRRACENLKVDLSSSENSGFQLDSLFEGHNFDSHLNRAQLEDIVEDMVRGTLVTVAQVLGEANLLTSAIDDVILVGGSSRIPFVKDMLRDFFATEPNENFNSESTVAYGAAIQAAILSGVEEGFLNKICLNDVNPMSLGIRSLNGVMKTIVRRNTPLSTPKTKIFSTNRDNQTRVGFKVFEGERIMADQNNCLGEVRLLGIPPAPKKVPQIEVCFKVDANGILKIEAKNLIMGLEDNLDIISTCDGSSSQELEVVRKDFLEMMEKWQREQ